jgi:protein AATF/BFR2
LRKLQHSIADPKYDGTKTSRKQLIEYDGSDYGSSEGDDDETSSEPERDEDKDELDNEVPSSQSELENEPDAPTLISTTLAAKSTASYKDPEHTENLTSRLRKTRDEDRKKGKAVSKQIVQIVVPFYVGFTNYVRRRCGTRYLMHVSVCRGLFLQEIGSHRLACRLISQYFPLTSTQLADYDDIQPSLVKMLAEAQLLSDELFHLQEVRLMNSHYPAPPYQPLFTFHRTYYLPMRQSLLFLGNGVRLVM